jgi:hypothetical protein
MDEFFEYWELIPEFEDYENIGKVSWSENSLLSQLMCHRCLRLKPIIYASNSNIWSIFTLRRS